MILPFDKELSFLNCSRSSVFLWFYFLHNMVQLNINENCIQIPHYDTIVHNMYIGYKLHNILQLR